MERAEPYYGTVAPTQFDIDHMSDIIAGSGDWFSAHLLRLIAKADLPNRNKIRQVYPEHVKAYEEWHSS